MAEPQESSQPNQEQEAILQRSPLLKEFLNQPPDNTGKWVNKLEPLIDPLEAELSQKLGDNWMITTLAPITLMAEEQKVFDTSMLEGKQGDLFNVVESLFLIGYEVGNKIDAFSFAVPVTKKLSQHSLLHQVPESESKGASERLFNTLWGIIQAGVFIRSYVEPESLTPSRSGKLPDNPFADFIKGLESIDKLPPKDANPQ